MKHDVLLSIEQRMNTFSKGQKRIAQLIFERPNEICFMTAAQIGKRADVSESTVVRFACELGYKGFPGLQKDLQKCALSQIDSKQYVPEIHEKTDDEKLLWANKNIDNILKTMELLDFQSLENAVSRLKNCRNIYLVSDVYSRGLQDYLKFHLSAVQERVIIVRSSIELMHLCPEDSVIFLCFGNGNDYVPMLSYARDSGAYMIGFTGSALTPAASGCDAVFVASTDACGHTSSLTAPVCLLQIFLECFIKGNEEQYFNIMEKLKDYQTKELRL